MHPFNVFATGTNTFQFKPQHPLYIRNNTKEKLSKQGNKKNRLFSLPTDILEKIYEYDDTPRRHFKQQVLNLMLYRQPIFSFPQNTVIFQQMAQTVSEIWKLPEQPPKTTRVLEDGEVDGSVTEEQSENEENTVEEEEHIGESSDEEDDDSFEVITTEGNEGNIIKEDTNYTFYKTVLNTRFGKNTKTPFCEWISCGLKTSTFVFGNEYPQPFELRTIYYRRIPKTDVKTSIYDYDGRNYYFIQCEMDMSSFVQELYQYKNEPTGFDFECFYFKNWEDVHPDNREQPFDSDSFCENIKTHIRKNQYKKIMISGDEIGDYHDIILYENENEQGKPEICIQVDFDEESVEDDMMWGVEMANASVLVKRKLKEMFQKYVQEVIQVLKRHRKRLEKERITKAKQEEKKRELKKQWDEVRVDLQWKKQQAVYAWGSTHKK